MSGPERIGLLGVYVHHDALMESIEAAREAGLTIREVFSPVPEHELVEAVKPGPSPVRYLTFLGAVAGLVGGLALAIWSSLQWDLVVQGKPVANVVPFLVVGFELLILLGALATLGGLLVSARLPHRGFPGEGFSREFTCDRFGLWLSVPDSEEQRARELMLELGAERVRRTDREEHATGGAT